MRPPSYRKTVGRMLAYANGRGCPMCSVRGFHADQRHEEDCPLAGYMLGDSVSPPQRGDGSTTPEAPEAPDAMRWIEVQPTPDGEAHVVRVLGPHEDTRDPDPDRWVCFRVEGSKLDAECLADELADIIGDIEAVARDDGDAVPDAPPGTSPKWPEPGDVSPSGLRRVPCGESKPSASGPHAIVFNKSCRACGGKGVNAIGSLCPYCIRLVPMRPATESTGMESAKRLLIDAITAVDDLGFRIELEDAADVGGSVYNLFAEIGCIRLVHEDGNR
ncbi:MAG TPA: hypothetical protein ENK57_12055 [Polyangiaceae bacterium]|nr:hypothetical protein [Polyangiaceae bacterium]